MNRSVLDTGGGACVVSQFTLYGDTRKGRRPSYNRAAPPEIAVPIYEKFCEHLRGLGLRVETGVFGAMMEVSYTNPGPVTILIDSEKTF
jgi:D-tyrosyl-tRNA(Tyr) deacylase